VAVASAGPYAIICTSLQTDNHHSIFTGQMFFLMPNQQRQRTEGTSYPLSINMKENDGSMIDK